MFCFGKSDKPNSVGLDGTFFGTPIVGLCVMMRDERSETRDEKSCDDNLTAPGTILARDMVLPVGLSNKRGSGAGCSP